MWENTRAQDSTAMCVVQVEIFPLVTVVLHVSTISASPAFNESSPSYVCQIHALMLEAKNVLGDAIWTLQRALALEVFSCSVATQVSSALAKSLLAPMKSHLSVLLEQRNDVSSSVYGLEAVVVLLKVIRCPVAQRELSSEEWCDLLLRHSIYFDDKEDANSVIQRLCIRVASQQHRVLQGGFASNQFSCHAVVS